MFPKTYFPKRYYPGRYFPPVASGGVVPSTGTPDVCYVACARNQEYTSSPRGTGYSGVSRNQEYTAIGGKG